MSGASAQRGLLVWSVAVAAYVLAVFCRTSLSVAGLLAAERFGIGASLLSSFTMLQSSFTMLQLLVYAVMQIPVGLLIDRFGPRAARRGDRRRQPGRLRGLLARCGRRGSRARLADPCG